MSEPEIAGRHPARVTLEAGEHYWCACGRSQSQPFCDGSHRGTAFQPLRFTEDAAGEQYLCLCKRTKNAPYCDGSHKRLPAAEASSPSPSVSSASAVNTAEEPTLALVHQLAREGLEKLGGHGPVGAMGVPRGELPHWDQLQFVTAQLARRPLADDAPVATEFVLGPRAKRPLRMSMPIFVSDMSFGALSEEAKVSMARGAERADTGICSGEGGMLSEEQAENTRYLYELASGKFGYTLALLERVQAFHFKAGQGAKTGTGGHLPGNKVVGKIAAVRGLPEGTPAVSPPTFEDLRSAADYRRFAEAVRKQTGGIPVGFKMSAQHIEADLGFALEAGADYIILDGRGGGTGAAPLIFRDHISVPTIPALARARRFLDRQGASDVSLVVTGGLRTPADFAKALALGADAVAIANSAMQAVGCVGARMCHTNRCPAGVATQDPALRARIDVAEASLRVERFLRASCALMSVLARACGHQRLADFSLDDLTTFDRDMSAWSGVRFGGVGAPD